MSLDNIVSLTITVQDAAVSQAGFGTILIMTHEQGHTVGETVEYSTTAAMVTAGFSATGATVLCATAALGQSPGVTSVKVYVRATTPTTQTRVITVDTVKNSHEYSITLNGTEFTFTSDATATNLEIATGLDAAINVGTVPVTSTDNGDGTFTLEEDVDGVTFGCKLGPYLTQDDTTTDAGIATDYAAAKVYDNDFYGVAITSGSTLEAIALAAEVESDRKLFGVTTNDSDVLAGTAGNIALTLQAAAYTRTFVIWNGDNWDYAATAWMGDRFPIDPGSSTWKFKTLAGVTYDDLTTTQVSNLDTADCNHYTRISSVNITREGTVASGRFIDITRGIDWLYARLQERIYTSLVNVQKIPFTDQGIAVIEGDIRAQLQEAVGKGLIAADPEFTVSVPAAADVSTANKASRTLPDITFSATLAGAIHQVTIAGTVSV